MDAPARLPRETPPAPRTNWSQTLAREILHRLRQGESLRAICRDPRMPHPTTVREWARRWPDDFGAAFREAQVEARLAAVAQADLQDDLARRRRRSLARDGRGRSTTYSPELGQAICARIAAGETVLAIGAGRAMPCAATIYGWVRRHKDFRKAYIQARKLQADLMFDAAWEFALSSTPDSVNPDRLRIQTLKWRLALMAPRKYGLRPGDLAPRARAEPEPPDVYIHRFSTPDLPPELVPVRR